jgi:hypothetical protein
MQWKEFLLNLGISTVTAAMEALIVTTGIGPQFKVACQNALVALAAVATAAETPNQ